MKQLGYYGKTPHRGDFVRFNLPRTFVNTWDDWLQTAIAQAESTYQSDWPSVYDSAPIYRFVLSTGIAGNTAWAGCMSAQRDKVGRRFPFCFALSLPDQPAPVSVIYSMQRWFDQIEDLCRLTHQEDFDFDQLQVTLESMTNELDQQKSTQSSDDSPIQAPPEADLDSLLIKLDNPNALLNASSTLPLLSCILDKTVGEYSVWMTSGHQPTTVLSAGLPRESAATALFSGHWNQTAASSVAAIATIAQETPEASSETIAVASVELTADDTQPIPSEVSTHDRNPADPAHSPDLSQTIPGEEKTVSGEKATLPVSATEQSAPSADDWAALADFETEEHTEEETITPTVEKLELDDVSEDVPWDT